MAIKNEGSNIIKIYKGNDKIISVFCGEQQIWGREITLPERMCDIEIDFNTLSEDLGMDNITISGQAYDDKSGESYGIFESQGGIFRIRVPAYNDNIIVDLYFSADDCQWYEYSGYYNLKYSSVTTEIEGDAYAGVYTYSTEEYEPPR
jgi:hypothetical protein